MYELEYSIINIMKATGWKYDDASMVFSRNGIEVTMEFVKDNQSKFI